MKTQTQVRPVNLNPVQYKRIDATKATTDGSKVTGYLSVFGVKDSDGDILIKGCYAKSIQERGPNSNTARKIAFLYQHDMDDPIGRFTMLKEDDFGLYFEAELDLGGAVESAIRTKEQLQSGTLNQFSVGFQYVWDKMEWDDAQEATIIKEVNLFEGSVVTLGANEFTYYAGMKGLDLKAKEQELIEETEQFIKSLPFPKQFLARQMISKNIGMVKASTEPDESTPDTETPDEEAIEFIDKMIPHHQMAIDMVAQYDGIDNQDLLDIMKDITESQAEQITEMKAIKKDIKGKKSLKTKKKPEPVHTPLVFMFEPVAAPESEKQLFQFI